MPTDPARPPDDERCDGSPACRAPVHIHGCYADDRPGICDDPKDHAPPSDR